MDLLTDARVLVASLQRGLLSVGKGGNTTEWATEEGGLRHASVYLFLCFLLLLCTPRSSS